MNRLTAHPLLKSGPEGYHFESPVQVGNRFVWVQIHATPEARSAGCVQWVELPEGALSEDGLDLTVHTVAFDEPVGAVMPTSDPDIVVVAKERRLETLNLSTGKAGELLSDAWGAVIESNPDVRLNDCRAGYDGEVYVGTMAYDCETPLGAWGRVDRESGFQPMIENVKVSNGFDWTDLKTDESGREYRYLVYVDSKSGKVDTHDDEDAGITESSEIWRYRHYMDDGSLGERHVLTSMTPVVTRQRSQCPVVADGGVMAFDSQGREFFVVTEFNGAAAHIVDVETGEIVTQIDIPAFMITSAGWAGDVLVFTTTREGLSGADPERMSSAEQEMLENSGNLFWVKVEGLSGRAGFTVRLD